MKLKIIKLKAVLLASVLLTAGCLGFCKTVDVTPEPTLPPGLKAKKDRIVENYKAGSCFLAGFNISIRNSEGSQSAVGEVRSDPQNRRLHLEFRVPYIGITLSQLSILEGQAYVKNVKMDRMETIPVENLMVQGMGQNSIRLPFIFFQELLFAGLPANVIEKGKWTENQDGSVSVTVKDPGQQVEYKFASGYLQQIQYGNEQSSENIQVDLQGLRSKSPAIPGRLVINARKAGSAPEAMIIDFGSVNPSADCGLNRFPTRF
ncbi:MAG TPA: hypothetical protein DEA96_12760 [Leptospiraceae bacterium]|jgi:hypothetical protein|nr:hypothetical protein [Spirochaetaceae bacterium]HBS05833.1 hypothetical protein [Leptospiraceae bacterium]|tara:strand:+ start:1026 stop:1808 length:783 start_codon:yes stop_codon:yes gene_type:complete